MAQCDICGKDAQLVDAVIEGSMLSVCEKCAKHGSVVPVDRPISRTINKEDGPELFVEDCSLQVRIAREKKGLTQEQLAKAIAEKESTIHHLETGDAKPSLKTAKKLEQFLDIKIIETYNPGDYVPERKINFKDSALTIGDLIKIRKEK